MKRIVLFIVFVLGYSSITLGQAIADSISMKKSFGGYHFYRGEIKVEMNKVVETMKSNEMAYRQIKSARNTNNVANFFGFAGGFMIGWPLGSAIAGGKPNWTLAGIGAALTIISIPIKMDFHKKARGAIDTYNRGLKATSYKGKGEVMFTASGTGYGLIIKL